MLHVAAQGDSPYALAYFRKMGISLNSKDRELSTPLHWACVSSASTVITYLLSWGAEVNSRDTGGYTPLHLAVIDLDKGKNFSTVKKLIMRGANLNSKDNMQRRPVDFAATLQNEAVRQKAIRILVPFLINREGPE